MIIFRNKGLIDERAITTFGVSSKEGENPIGQFGTGLKYAIAIVLRNGGSITIWRGEEELRFTVRSERIRVDDFDIVCMNGRELGFTTSLGRHWETWQAFREVYCNAIDEGGMVHASTDEFAPTPGHTSICVTGANFEKHFAERDKIVLSTEVMLKLASVEVHAGESDHIFYRGIRVWKLPKPSLFTYNLTDFQVLTEDRTLAYTVLVPGEMARSIVQASTPAFLDAVLRAKKSHFESNFDWNDAKGATPSDVFMQVAADLYARKQLGNAAGLFQAYTDRISGYTSAYLVALTPIEQAVIDRSRSALAARGIETDQFQVVVKSSLGGENAVVVAGHVITLAAKVLQRGDREVARCILLGVARAHGGSIEDQLVNFILDGAMHREPALAEADEMPF